MLRAREGGVGMGYVWTITKSNQCQVQVPGSGWFVKTVLEVMNEIGIDTTTLPQLSDERIRKFRHDNSAQPLSSHDSSSSLFEH